MAIEIQSLYNTTCQSASKVWLHFQQILTTLTTICDFSDSMHFYSEKSQALPGTTGLTHTPLVYIYKPILPETTAPGSIFFFWFQIKFAQYHDLKLIIQKTKIMASGPIILWHINAEKMETSDRFIFLGSKITVDSDWRREIKRFLFLGRKAMTNLDSVLKSRDITLLTKV